MKKIILIILIGIIINPGMSHAQLLPDQKKTLYQEKVISFTKMKHTGIGLTIGGIALTAAGVVLMVNGVNQNNNNYDNNYYYSSNNETAKFWVGYIGACIGVGATIGGVVLWAIGGSKVKKYEEKLNALSFHLNPGSRQNFSLAYRF